MTQPATPTVLDRSLRALRSLIRAENPNRTFFGTYEYQIQRGDVTTFDGSPTEENLGLPSLVGVPYRPSLAGSSCVPTQGTLAYVTFANADPSKPILIAFGPTLPTSSNIDAALGGTVTAGATATTVNLGGVGATALAKAQNITVWATLVVASVNQCAAFINAIIPGSVTLLVPIADPATTKVRGV